VWVDTTIKGMMVAFPPWRASVRPDPRARSAGTGASIGFLGRATTTTGISAGEVEAAPDNPAVQEAALIGVPDDDRGQAMWPTWWPISPLGPYDRAGADDVGCPRGQVRGHHVGGDPNVFEAPIGEMVAEQGWKRC
jgi:hypothetical protein